MRITWPSIPPAPPMRAISCRIRKRRRKKEPPIGLEAGYCPPLDHYPIDRRRLHSHFASGVVWESRLCASVRTLRLCGGVFLSSFTTETQRSHGGTEENLFPTSCE